MLTPFWKMFLWLKQLFDTRLQWRNSYGLRVGKPAGTRAEGAPAGCAFTLVFQLRLPFQRGAPFKTLFLRNSHNDAFHEIRIIWVPLEIGPGWGRNFTYVTYTGMWRPNESILHKRSANIGTILTPAQKVCKTRWRQSEYYSIIIFVLCTCITFILVLVLVFCLFVCFCFCCLSFVFCFVLVFWGFFLFVFCFVLFFFRLQ